MPDLLGTEHILSGKTHFKLAIEHMRAYMCGITDLTLGVSG
jgi:hypothetical protein